MNPAIHEMTKLVWRESQRGKQERVYEEFSGKFDYELEIFHNDLRLRGKKQITGGVANTNKPLLLVYTPKRFCFKKMVIYF